MLDALPSDERTAFEDHLELCPDCRAEAAELLATAAHLGQATAVVPSPTCGPGSSPRSPAPARSPPAGTWWTPRAPVGAGPWSWPRRPPSPSSWPSGALVLQADHRADRAEQVAAIVAAPDAETVEMTAEGAGTMRLVASPGHGGSVLVSDDMAAPPPGKAYALWFQVDGEMQAEGVFTPDADGQVRHTVDGVPADVVGVTIEDAAGADEPTLPIIAQGSDLGYRRSLADARSTAETGRAACRSRGERSSGADGSFLAWSGPLRAGGDPRAPSGCAGARDVPALR